MSLSKSVFSYFWCPNLQKEIEGMPERCEALVLPSRQQCCLGPNDDVEGAAAAGAAEAEAAAGEGGAGAALPKPENPPVGCAREASPKPPNDDVEGAAAAGAAEAEAVAAGEGARQSPIVIVRMYRFEIVPLRNSHATHPLTQCTHTRTCSYTRHLGIVRGQPVGALDTLVFSL